jgi:hypothetical protein
MKIRSVMMMASCTVMGGMMLAGCQSNSGSSASGSSATTQAGSTASAGAVNVMTSNSPTATATGTGSSGKSGGYAICQAKDLNISLASSDDVSSQITQWVQLENATSTPCTMDGFAGVDLVGTASGKSNYSWPLDRDSEKYSKITLEVGESAYFGITYLPWASGDGTKFSVAKIVMTPPNTTASFTLPWDVSVLLQDAATHPGTYLTPIALGGK